MVEKKLWEKAGTVSMSNSKKVILLAVYGLDIKKWLIIDVLELQELIAGHRAAVPILEKAPMI